MVGDTSTGHIYPFPMEEVSLLNLPCFCRYFLCTLLEWVLDFWIQYVDISLRSQPLVFTLQFWTKVRKVKSSTVIMSYERYT